LHKSKGETDLKISSHQASSVKEDYDEDAFEEEMKALFVIKKSKSNCIDNYFRKISKRLCKS